MQKEIESIKKRNKRVEIDKAWEVSFSRRAIIAIITYVTVLIFLLIIKAPNPYLSSLVPTIGFILSTLTIPIFKKIWIRLKSLKHSPN